MTNLPVAVDVAFRVYGDNILECLIFVDWLNQAQFSKFEKIGSTGPVDREIHLYKSIIGKTTLSK